MNFKVGERVTGYTVVDLVNDTTECRVAVYTVDGDENGEPLCLRIDDGKAADRMGHWGGRTFQFEDIATTEEDAIRRYKAELLMKAIRCEQEAAGHRARLKRPIKLVDGARARPEDPKNPQLRVRVDERGK